jgi:UDP-sulfoquinovose synthase
VYGTGGQTRGFIHISDTARCIEIAINNPPKAGGKVEVFNQIAETLRVRDLAQTISNKSGVPIRHLENPRKEDAENELDVANAKFKAAGLNPITVEMGLMEEVVDITKKYSDRCDRSKVLPSAFWTKGRASAAAADTNRTEDKGVRA